MCSAATPFCFSGTPNGSYQPQGEIQEFGSSTVYHSMVSSDFDVRTFVIFLPDGFGLAQHNLYLADKYAARGFETYVLDYFEGDALPEYFMGVNPTATDAELQHLSTEEIKTIRKIDLEAWRQRHNSERLYKLVEEFIEYFRSEQQDIIRVHIVGHCFGGKYAFLEGKKGYAQSVVSIHPAFLTAGDVSALKCPTFVGCAESDIFTPSVVTDVVSSLGKCNIPSKCCIYGGTEHGFASRADLNDVTALKAFESCFEDTVRWMTENSVS